MSVEPNEAIDYSPHDEDTFNVWVELGALNPDLQRIIDHSPFTRHTIKVKSSSPEAEELIHRPLERLLRDGIPGVHEGSRVVSRIIHHERGLDRRIIFVTATVDDDGNATLDYEKQLPEGG
jgi:hypothetical protein